MKAVDRAIFSGLPESTREVLFSLGTIRTAAKGKILFEERADMPELLIVLEGYVSLYRSSFQGNSRVIFICSTGEILNEVCLENEKTSVAASTLSDVQLLCIPRDAALALARKDAAFAQAAFHSLAQKTRRLYHKIGNANGTYALKNRLAATLWKLARDYGEDTPVGRTVAFEITVNFLADLMGTKRETVSRALSEMKRSGLITHENGTLAVLNLQGLKDSITQ